jgi:hypothetical protein
MAQWNKNTGDFLNQERSLFEVIGVATSDGNIVSADNPFPVSIGSSNITINGNITIPGIVSVTSSPDNPIHNHIVEVGTGGTLTVPYLPVGISTLLNTVGIGSTGQVSINVNNAPVSNTNPLPVNLPSVATDAFGRQRISQPLTLFDSSHRYRDNNLWSGLVVGTGSTVGFVTAQGLINIGIGTTAGCSAIRETTKVFSYQPGKSLLVLNTFVMNAPKTNLRQRVGYFGADNGMYLELDGNTLYFVERSLSTATTTRVAQSSWNIDRLDGTGASGITLDTTKAQILWMDIEWLGLGTVRMGFVINGQFIHCHSFHHANVIESTYITTASLPLRYEIENTGITTSVSTIKQVCSTVISEGGYELRGLQQAISIPINSPRTLGTAGTFYPVIGLRLKASPNRLDAIIILTALSMMPISNGNFNWQVRASGTTSGGTWVSAGVDSAVEYNITGTSYTDGRILASGFFSGSNSVASQVDILKEALFKFQLERNGLTGSPYEITLVMASDSSNDTAVASMDWEEISR